MPPKKKARANGEGSLYQRASDDMWVGSVTLPDGKRKPVYAKTQAKARAKLKELQAKIDAGLPITSGKGVTLARWLTEEWVGKILPQRVKAGRLAESTLVSYSDNVRLHLIPGLGHLEIGVLGPAHVRVWLGELQVKPPSRSPRRNADGVVVTTLSPRMVAYCHAILRKALADAMRDEIVTRNVALLVEPPKGEGARGKSLTEEEASRLLEHAAGDRWADLWVTILGLALRKGEALALRWSTLDLEAGLAAVGPSLQRVRAVEADANGRRPGVLKIVGGKTSASMATVQIPPFLLAVLLARKERVEEEREAADVWVEPDLVFTTRYGTPIEPRNVNRAWDVLCAKAGVEGARVHDLRHSAASWLFEGGSQMKDIQRALRHARLATTSEIYTHFSEKTQARTTAVMDAALRRLAGETPGTAPD